MVRLALEAPANTLPAFGEVGIAGQEWPTGR